MSFADFQHPPPVSWEAFENLCLSLYRMIWNDPSAQKNGRRGNAQNGVDIWGRLCDKRWAAVQCKGKDALYRGEVTAAELRTEAEKARKFKPPLHSWTLATGGPKSAAIQEEARLLSEEHRSLGLFEVHVQGWEDLRELIAEHPSVIERHFPSVAPSYVKMAYQVEQIHDFLDPLRVGTPAHPVDILRRGVEPAREDHGLDAAAASGLRRTLGAASRHLLNWPTTIGDMWFARPELDTLAAHVAEDDPAPLVLLGPPGAGKSALLARLGNDLSSRGIALLALKADAIPPRVASMAELDEFLGVPEPLEICLRRLAIDQPVIFLVDQLDALADLMDQHGGRLHVLLRLVAQVRDCPNLAIVLSCREFEFRHDARLTTLRAEELRLQPVDWVEAEVVLLSRGLSPVGWHPEFREVLQVPQHLDIFLRFLASADGPVTFTSYHEMLEAVFRRRVLTKGPEGEQNAAALYAVARAMGQDEDLWVPAARFDGHSLAIARMEAAGFLRREGLKLGFQHQTLFDFVRARAFVTDGERVADYALARQGTIFARPTIWSALSYLRASDRQAYEREMQRIWSAGPRPHLRGLLRDLMGQQQDPGDEEARRLMPLLMDPSSRMRTLQAMTESKGWFRRLRPRIPALMLDPGGAGWFAANLLRSRVNDETGVVLGFMRAHWNSVDHHERVSRVLEELKDWTPDAVDLAMVIAPGMNSFSVIRFAEKMPLPALHIAGFVLARLKTVELPSQAASMNLFQGPHVFPGLPELMLRHPATFVRMLWP